MGTEPNFATAYTFSKNSRLAARELKQQLTEPNINFMLFFCSAEYDLAELADALNTEFEGIPMSGCTTAGEITPQGYGQGCISAIGFFQQGFAIEIALIENLEQFSLTDAQIVVEKLIEGCRKHEIAPIKGNTFALTLFDGLAIQEENALIALNSALGSIPSFGGSAGDDRHLTKTHVFHEGKFHSGAGVVLLMNTFYDFLVFSTHHMTSLGEKLIVTEADADARRVYELNAEPAAKEYARAIGVPLEDLNHEVFALNPIAVRIGDEYFVRSIQQVNDDLSLVFYCAVENGIVMTVMEPGEMTSDLIQKLDNIHQKISEPQLIISCDCFLRRMESELLGYKDSVSDILKQNNVIGFSSYGEQMEGMHVNQTFTGVALGRNPDVG